MSSCLLLLGFECILYEYLVIISVTTQLTFLELRINYFIFKQYKTMYDREKSCN